MAVTVHDRKDAKRNSAMMKLCFAMMRETKAVVISRVMVMRAMATRQT